MPIVVGVSFKKAGKIYYFGPKDLDIKEGDHVITVTARGSKLGYVAQGPKEVSEEEIVGTLKDVERIATPEDIEKEASHREREKEAMVICQEKIEKHNLPMELLEAELSFDETMITFFFSADGRIDFRELVKDIAYALHLKIQLLQIGVRDKAKLVGGYGSCGQQLCCNRFLTNFEPVSMKMAKDQSLFLNPAKFSGCCGKLMCCLKFEHDYYSDAQNSLPNPGVVLKCEHGLVKVKDYNLISNMVILEKEDGSIVNMPISKVVEVGVCKRHGICTEKCDENCHKITHEELDYLGVYNVKEFKEENTFIGSSAFEGKSINFDNFKGLLDDEEEEEIPKPKHNKNKKPNKTKPIEKDTTEKPEKVDKIEKDKKDKKGQRPFKLEKNDLSGIVFRDVSSENDNRTENRPNIKDTNKPNENIKEQGKKYKPRPFNKNFKKNR